MLKPEIYYVNEPDISWLVTEFQQHKYEGLNNLTEKFMPRTDVGFVFHFKNTSFVWSNGNPVKLPPLYIAPINKQFLNVCLNEDIDTFYALCKPTVLSRILNIGLSPTNPYIVDVPKTVFHPLWEQMAPMTTMQERMDCFKEFFLNIHQKQYVPDSIDILFENIVEKSIGVPVKDIMQACCSSERTMERRFKIRAGVSIKTVMRLARFEYLWKKVRNEYVTDYQDLVFYGNFFDQTHYIKDFKNITGETPDYFFHRNLEILNILSGRMPML